MPPILAAAGIAAVGSIGAAVVTNNAQKSAAKTAAAAQEKAVDSSLEIAKGQENLYREQYAKSDANLRPHIEAGYGALGVVQQLLGLKNQTAEQFSAGERYTPGTIDYSKPEQVRATNPAPATAATGQPDLNALAVNAIQRGANPAEVAARLYRNRFGDGGSPNAV